ncbi:MAG: outer membrane beta-barrel protein [bacterium]
MKTFVMKKAVLLASLIMMTPLLASAQSRFSVAPALGFYKAELDKLVDFLGEIEKLGVEVQKPNGGLQFGGRLNYEKSPQLTLRAEAYYWQDQGNGNLRDVDGTLSFANKVRLVPIMLGAQYNFGQPEAKIRFYAGASGGVMLVKTQSQIALNLADPNEESIEELTESSGSDFIGKPFVGLELGTSRKLAFFTEVGYVFGKFTSEEADLETGEPTSLDISINGLHLIGGMKIAF